MFICNVVYLSQVYDMDKVFKQAKQELKRFDKEVRREAKKATSSSNDDKEEIKE